MMINLRLLLFATLYIVDKDRQLGKFRLKDLSCVHSLSLKPKIGKFRVTVLQTGRRETMG